MIPALEIHTNFYIDLEELSPQIMVSENTEYDIFKNNISLIKTQEASLDLPVKEPSHKNDSLKFCRKLVKYQLKFLNDETSFVNMILKASFNILLHIGEVFHIKDKGQLQSKYFGIVKSFWLEQRDHFSYSKNKKISILSMDIWKRQFEEKSFKEFITQKLIYNEIIGEAIEASDNYEKDAFVLFSKALLFKALQFINLTIAICYLDRPGKAEKKFPMKDNFIVFMLEPSLYGYYNHTKGKFFSECCERCRVCRLKDMDPEGVNLLDSARKTFADVKGILSEMKALNYIDINTWTVVLKLIQI
mmetsp:Transcript_36785/g.42981  ORF Transcript_36785/g.42981 Transcript_36785/m.42981 type:complete len:303 (-) Transcript_36785:165-1073(-)